MNSSVYLVSGFNSPILILIKLIFNHQLWSTIFRAKVTLLPRTLRFFLDINDICAWILHTMIVNRYEVELNTKRIKNLIYMPPTIEQAVEVLISTAK